VLVHTLLPLLVLGLWQRDRRVLGMLAPAWGWWIAAAIALPWFITVIVKVPGLLSYFLVHQTWERFTTTVHQRGGPPWYFVAVLIAGMLPWTPLLIAGIGNAVRTLRAAAPPDSAAARAADESRMALAWLFVPLVFFSFSGSKLPSYLLPCVPAAALLTASGAGSVIARRISAVLLVVLAIAGAFAGPSILAKLISLDPAHPLPLSAGLWIAPAAFALAAFSTFRGRLVPAAMLVVVAWAAAEVGLARYEGPLGSPRPAMRLLASQVRPHEPVIEVEKFLSAVPFYLGRTVLLLDVEREQRLDVSAELAAVTVTSDSLPGLVERHGRVWLVGPPTSVRALAEAEHLRFTVLTRWKDRVIGFVSR
jgi:4-amino-4-deoxy-L-arabinose transferase-like glycosyltransferase